MRFVLIIDIWALSNWGLTFYRLSLLLKTGSYDDFKRGHYSEGQGTGF